jgi:hypothetical protein
MKYVEWLHWVARDRIVREPDKTGRRRAFQEIVLRTLRYILFFGKVN